MGGANNPLGQLSDALLKEEQSPSPITISDREEQTPLTKPVLETTLTQTEEKSPSTGLRPGER